MGETIKERKKKSAIWTFSKKHEKVSLIKIMYSFILYYFLKRSIIHTVSH